MAAPLAFSAASSLAMAGAGAASGLAAALKSGAAAKTRQAAQDFEAVFLNAMFGQMFTGIDGEGPFGGTAATGVWRSLLAEEYSKSAAKAGGIGIANHVYESLFAQQEAKVSEQKGTPAL